MISISFSWDTEKRMASIRWNCIGSLEWREGAVEIKAFRFPLPVQIRFKQEKVPNIGVLLRWRYIKGLFSLLKDLKIHEVEATVSLPDPMINGILYGGWAIFQHKAQGKGIYGRVNFLGQNRCKGKVSLSLKDGLSHFKKWIFPMLQEGRRRGKRKEG